ncbi:MAG: hypothetical protein GX552_03835 [Chloroflexi bacterium]|nr:hypothetical protein [Chloroflexota bacterium]
MTLLRTKLYAPLTRAELVPRPRLLERLDAGLAERRKLTLVSAPAGYGKTTLVAAWLAQKTEKRLRSSWLSLDAEDNDPARFAGYMLAALQGIDASLGRGIPNPLEMAHLPPLSILLEQLLNELLALETQGVLVLDDYHVLTNPMLHEALAYFIEHQPQQIHLVLTTREDPPLPLARLRARAQLTELRTNDLRFTPDEARQFFRCSISVELEEDALDTLETRTEGWAVGLQLAALALQHLPNRQGFLSDFGGSHRYVIDYLAEEVIRQQDNETRRFLARTSILDRLCGPLCDALLANEKGPPAAAMLQALEKANLFLIPLDGERKWYRYHHLFADYLRAGLPVTERPTLYKRAAAWHEANGLVAEAIHYALSSGDADFAADVIARALEIESTWSGGNLARWQSWLQALPPQAFHHRPQLSLNASRILYLSGRFEQAEAQLALTEQTLATLPEPERASLLALVALYRGAIAAVRGDSSQAIAQITFAQERLPLDNHLAHARAFFSLGLAYEIADQTSKAVENYVRSSQQAQSAGVLFLAIHALCAAAQIQIKQGRLDLAEETCQAAIRLAEGARLPPLGLAWSILGGIALERNDLACAEKWLTDGVALSRQGGLMDDVTLGLTLLARLRFYRDDPVEALALMQEAKSLLQAFGVQRTDLLASAYLARLQLYLDRSAAAQWAADMRLRHACPSHEFIDLTLARVLLATGELDEIPALLQPLLERAEAAGRVQTCIEVLLLLALYHQARDDTPAALNRLMQALHLAAPAGLVRMFLDEGDRLQTLLPQVRAAAPDFVDKLLPDRPEKPDGRQQPRLRQQLPDPLTEQEKRVLELIVAGKSNQEIAEELFISVGTAKWHVHNTLQKLAASNRAQAIARARELGLD